MDAIAPAMRRPTAGHRDHRQPWQGPKGHPTSGGPVRPRTNERADEATGEIRGVVQRCRLPTVNASVVDMPDRAISQLGAEAPAARQVVEAVHTEHGQQLWGFVRRLGLADEEAGEVTQEALLRLWRVCRDGQAPDHPVAWAYRTAYRLAMDRHRVRRRWLAFVGRQDRRGPEAIEGSDERIAVWAEVDRLPERQRQVLYLRYRADLTFVDIGKVLGIDAGSARSNGSRGIAALRARLAGKDE